MPCTTILVGKNATYDGSTMIARNDDAGGNDHFTPKWKGKESGARVESMRRGPE